MRSVLAIILGGGAGQRLFPLTHVRSKPAVPFGGKYRLIDVPISNCLNSSINRIFILTQFNSASLNHHVTNTYRFSIFSKGFVNILAAEQTPTDAAWFQGTADAVRQMQHHLASYRHRHTLILSGDQLYQMDFNPMLAAHEASGAALTVATIPVTAEDATGFGIMKTDPSGRIVEFVEKPPAEKLAGLESDTGAEPSAQGRRYLASMGIYVFNHEVLFSLLAAHPELVDFGKHVIPHAISRMPVHGYRFDGYWTDVGTVGSFFDANMDLCEPLPRFNLYDATKPVYTHARMLPPTKTLRCRVDRAVLGHGAVLDGADVEHSVIGLRSVVRENASLRNCVLMGADYYESAEEIAHATARGIPPIGIGPGARLERVIVDKNARVGRGVTARSWIGREDADGPGWHVRDGILVITKGAVIPDGSDL